MAISLVGAYRRALLGTSGESVGSVDTTGANLLVVSTLIRDLADDVTAVTHQGDALSMLVQVAGGPDRARLWYRQNPTQAALGSVVITTNGSDDYETGVLAFSGVDSATPTVGQTNTASGDSATASVSITPDVAGCVVVCALIHEASDPITLTSGQAQHFGIDQGAWGTAVAYRIQTTAATETFTWTFPGGEDTWGAVVAYFRPASAPVGATITTTADPATSPDTTASVRHGGGILASAPDGAFAVDAVGSVLWGGSISSVADPAIALDTTGSFQAVSSISTSADPATAQDTVGSATASVDIQSSSVPAVAIDTLADVGGGTSASITSLVDAAFAVDQSASVWWGTGISSAPDAASGADTTGEITLGVSLSGVADPADAEETVGSVWFGLQVDSSPDAAVAVDTIAIVSETSLFLITGVVDPASSSDRTASVLASSSILASVDAAVAVDTVAQLVGLASIASTRGVASSVDTLAQILASIAIESAIDPAQAVDTVGFFGLRRVFGYDASRRTVQVEAFRRLLSFPAGKPSPQYNARRRDLHDQD